MKQPTATSESTSAAPGDQQAPLGTEPSYDDLLDLAVEYTFPCSDPVAVQQGCDAAGLRERAARREAAKRAE